MADFLYMLALVYPLHLFIYTLFVFTTGIGVGMMLAAWIVRRGFDKMKYNK